MNSIPACVAQSKGVYVCTVACKKGFTAFQNGAVTVCLDLKNDPENCGQVGLGASCFGLLGSNAHTDSTHVT